VVSTAQVDASWPAESRPSGEMTLSEGGAGSPVASSNVRRSLAIVGEP
jgi:hypothetical protein